MTSEYTYQELLTLKNMREYARARSIEFPKWKNSRNL